ncbi:hypothetical protein ACQCU1_03255 [Sutcliffiella horikoshii]|uniref:hypothetical protein n=1 Tax=Sutcliffiella horikoshii TaxID=79883 RepID=UPI003CE917FA
MLDNHLVHAIRQLQGNLVELYSDINIGASDIEEVKNTLATIVLSIDRENPHYNFENDRSQQDKKIMDLTKSPSGYLLHTISVECSYHQLKDARKHDAISFIARTDGDWNGKKVNALDYAIECSTEDAREFAQCILSLCDEIELSKVTKTDSIK